MKILVKKVGEPCEVKEYDKLGLDDMQALVGGFVECLRIDFGTPDHPVEADVWLNEEGKLHDKFVPNIVLFGSDGKVVDVIVGDIFIADNNEDGAVVGLTDEQLSVIPQVLEILAPQIADGNGGTYPLPFVAV